MDSAAVRVSSAIPRGLRGLAPFLIAIPILAALQLAVSGMPFLVYIASIVGVLGVDEDPRVVAVVEGQVAQAGEGDVSAADRVDHADPRRERVGA